MGAPVAMPMRIRSPGQVNALRVALVAVQTPGAVVVWSLVPMPVLSSALTSPTSRKAPLPEQGLRVLIAAVLAAGAQRNHGQSPARVR